MPNTTCAAIADLDISPTVRRSMEAIELPDVQEMIRRLGEYGLGVCVPHRHTATMDFDDLPDDLVQVEENCQVSWVPRDQLKSMRQMTPVAWKWQSGAADGVVAAAECIVICSYANDPKKSHKKHHQPGA